MLGYEDNQVVHCPTKGLARKVLKVCHERGMTWGNGKSFLDEDEMEWDQYKRKTCYNFNVKGFSSLDHYTKENYEIISAQTFMKFWNQIPDKSVDLSLREEPHDLELSQLADGVYYHGAYKDATDHKHESIYQHGVDYMVLIEGGGHTYVEHTNLYHPNRRFRLATIDEMGLLMNARNKNNLTKGWHINPYGEGLDIKILIYCDVDKSYGFDCTGAWCDKLQAPQNTTNFRPASDEEVESILVKEAKRRGYKDNIEVKETFTAFEDNNDFIVKPVSEWGTLELNDGFSYCGPSILTYSGMIIFANGSWSKLREPKPHRFKEGERLFVTSNDYKKLGIEKGQMCTLLLNSVADIVRVRFDHKVGTSIIKKKHLCPLISLDTPKEKVTPDVLYKKGDKITLTEDIESVKAGEVLTFQKYEAGFFMVKKESGAVYYPGNNILKYVKPYIELDQVLYKTGDKFEIIEDIGLTIKVGDVYNVIDSHPILGCVVEGGYHFEYKDYKSTKLYIEQDDHADDICKLCENEILECDSMTSSFMCEGCSCEDATERFLENMVEARMEEKGEVIVTERQVSSYGYVEPEIAIPKIKVNTKVKRRKL